MLYDLAIAIYDILVHLDAPFSRKPRKMMKGHWVVYQLLRQKIEKDSQYIWFHAASLGEFEQGRPLIERIRAQYPEYKILLTFFSPSGYEVRKNYRGADVVCYLPFDKPRNVKKFIDLANPCMAFFIKYEFWKNYIDELHRRSIPVYSVSSIFRRSQVFFKWYGVPYRKVLSDFNHLFVQNETSRRYLSKIGINNATVVGDTRFDRVLQIRDEAKDLQLIDKFKGNSLVFVAGSSWEPDEELFIEYFNDHPEMKMIIAPHVIDENHLVYIRSKLRRPYVQYTRADEQNVLKADCLIIDCFGLLSSIYRYGEIAYIGGGFHAGIHNTLEAAVYGIPVIFGPRYEKFMEAVELIEHQGAFTIQNYEELNTLLDTMLTDKEKMQEWGDNARNYVTSNAGATEKILSMVEFKETLKNE
ncbi:MAG: 3-deoxy-D-manno-octulosonic acid transferase [Bacteroidales bacterium]|nr:3-deoxy-D-manno-octulosonic acid transferase [Bacteroidales bacterium]